MILLNDKYKPLFENKTRYNVVSGGRGSGKSFSVALYLLLLTFEDSRTILFARYTMTSIAISIFPEFKDKIEMLNLESIFDITKSEIINKKTGSKIIFRGIKTGSSIQTANLKSIANVDTLVIDEAEEIPDEETFDKIDLSIRSSKHFNKIIILFNPTTKASWIYERFYEKRSIMGGCNMITDDVTYIHTTYKDVEDKLPDSLLESIRRRMVEDPKWYEHIILGGFLDVAEGVIFDNWEIGDFNEDSDWECGADFGWSNDPNTLVKVSIDQKRKIIWLKEELYKTGLTTDELGNIFRNVAGSKLIIADSAEGRLIEEIKRSGINIKPCVKGAGSVKEGVLLMKNYKIIIDESSKNLIKEFNNYVWAERGERPVDMYNHLLDAARYIISHRLKKPNVQKYKIR
jgi:phage terminase large subunit